VKNVEMQAAPMNFDLLRTLNGKKFPYDWQGDITGTVRASGGPLNHFKIEESALVFEDAHVPGAVTEARGQGELDILFPAFTAFHDFYVDVASLDLRTIQYLNPLFPRIKGTVSGTATLDCGTESVSSTGCSQRARIKLSAKNGKISAVFSGSDRDVLKMIEEQSEGLKGALQGRGLKLEELRFEARA